MWPQILERHHPYHRARLVLLGACLGTLLLVPAALAAEPNDPLAGTGELFADYPKFNARSQPVVCLITTQEPAEIRQALTRPDGMAKLLTLKARLKELSNHPCLLIHYLQIQRNDLEGPNVRAIVLSSWKLPRDKKHAAELDALLRETRKPLIAFCGGHALLYLAHGGKCAAMRKLKPGEKDPHPVYYPGLFKEWGPMKVHIERRDPVFEGLPDDIVVPEMHYAECKVLPSDFDLLASTQECKIQVIKHKTRLVYGTQFHPERYDDQHPDGKVLLQNFFRLAGCLR
jgi:GMP synthase-like glutamine amidotransferase